ncbi:MAG: 23S rRNA (pseudouridine(1915)-N(3))-methyltransferase RlmH [Bacillota bacterium]
MIRLHLVAVGTLKEPYLREAAAEYLRRLGPLARVTVHEVKETQAPPPGQTALVAGALAVEGEALLNRLRDSWSVIALDREGGQLSSEEIAAYLQGLTVQGRGDAAVLIGGAMGLADRVLQRADLRLSLGRITLPHQLCRIVVLEQLYRALKLIRGAPYHR